MRKDEKLYRFTSSSSSSHIHSYKFNKFGENIENCFDSAHSIKSVYGAFLKGGRDVKELHERDGMMKKTGVMDVVIYLCTYI